MMYSKMQETVLSIVIAWFLIFQTAVAQNDPTNVACTVLSSSSIQLSWTRPTNLGVNGYHLSIERVDGIINGPGIPSIDLSSYTYVSYTYSGLGNYAQYNLTIHSYIGSSNYSDVTVTCTTLEDAPNGAPTNFNCTAVSETEITCAWDALQQAYWNGILQGYRIQWLGENVSEIYSANVSNTVYQYTASSLYMNTRYIFLLCGFNNVNYGTIYSTDVETTIGATVKPVENVTRYYCYEAVPGMIEFSWDEMPCTIYSGTIAGLLFLSLLLISILGCQACCQKTAGPGVEINMMDGTSPKSSRRDDDDDDGNTTVTDDEDDLGERSDNNHDETETVRPESDTVMSPVTTPSVSEGADYANDGRTDFECKRNELSRGSIMLNEGDNEFYDSDYNSDIDEEKFDPKNHGNKKHEHQKVKITNLAVQQTKTMVNKEASNSANREKELEIEDSYEEWNPDSIPITNSKLVVTSLTHQVSVFDSENKSKLNSNGNEKINPNDAKFRHTREHPSDWHDDVPIERTASVSSILVDAQNSLPNSVWSPDIHIPNNQKMNGNLTKNILFRTNSTISMKRLSFNDTVSNPLEGKINTFERNDSDSQQPARLQDNGSEKVASHIKEMPSKDLSDNIEHINLMEDLLPNVYKNPAVASIQKDKIVKNNIPNTATAPVWLSERQRNEIRQKTNVTPIQKVNITNNSVIVDIEPVIGSDRIGKRFPFLSLENDGEKEAKLIRKSFTTNAWSRPSKTKRMPMTVNPKSDVIVQDTCIAVTSDVTVEEHTDNLRTDTKENNGQVFYGFGIGRFRKVATNWLNKHRMKRNNVKLANSKWD